MLIVCVSSTATFILISTKSILLTLFKIVSLLKWINLDRLLSYKRICGEEIFVLHYKCMELAESCKNIFLAEIRLHYGFTELEVLDL